jgi:hypothetical protein
MGGQAGTSSRIRNFLGFPAGISGSELAERAFQQAWMFGAEFVFINGAARRLDVRLSKGTFAMSAARRAPDQLDMRPPSLHIYASWSCTENARSCRGQGRAPLARRGFSHATGAVASRELCRSRIDGNEKPIAGSNLRLRVPARVAAQCVIVSGCVHG